MDALVIVDSFDAEYLAPLLGKVDILVATEVDEAEHPRVHYWGPTAAIRYLKQYGAKFDTVSHQNFGLFFAWTEGVGNVIMLGSACDTRQTSNFLERVPVGQIVPAIPFLSKSGWFNTLSLLTEDKFYARGYPYQFRAESHSRRYDLAFLAQPSFNQGLWTGAPDINGVDRLLEDITIDREQVEKARVQVGHGQHLPLSLLNAQLASRLAPAFFQPPSFSLYGGWRIHRHSDIWSMYFLKALMDKVGDEVTVGGPLVFRDPCLGAIEGVIDEHNASMIQGHLTTAIDLAARDVTPSTNYAVMALQLALSMASVVRAIPGLYGQALLSYAEQCKEWAILFL